MGFALGAAAIGGALISANATSNAAGAETGAANQANSTEMSQYNLNRQDMQPYIQSGQAALGQLNQQLPALDKPFSLADFQQSPAYQFNLQQGQQAIERSAAARGGMDSGDTMKALDSYNQGEAANQYQNAYNNYNTNNSNTFNRLSSVAGMGLGATSANAANGTAVANSIGSNLMSAGNANAAASVAQGNNISSLLNKGANTWGSYQLQSQNGGFGSSGYNVGGSSVPNVGSASGYNYNQSPSNFFNDPSGGY